MDQATITGIATIAISFLALYLAKAGEAVSKKTGEDLYESLKARFSDKPSAQEALTDLANMPDDSDLQAALRVQLKKLLAEDESFATKLQQLLNEAGKTKGGATIIEQIAKDNATQIGQVFGNITLIEKNMQKAIDEDEHQVKLTAIIPTINDTAASISPVTSYVPRSLIPIKNKTILQHILGSLYRNKKVFDRVIVVAHQEYSEAIQENIRQGGYGEFVEFRTTEQRKVPLLLKELGNDIKDKPFLVHYTNTLIQNADWNRYLNKYKESKGQHPWMIGMIFCSSIYPIEIGYVKEKASEPNIVLSFEEKPQEIEGSSLANLAVAIFEPVFLENIEDHDKSIFGSVLERVIQHKKVVGLTKVGKWYHLPNVSALWWIQNKEMDFNI